jgi:hypothetical protein
MNKLLTILNISDNNILGQHDIIDENIISYDTIKKEISLLKLTAYQKSLSNKNLIFNKYGDNYTIYLIEIQERLPTIFTVIIYIYTDYIAPIYLLNYKDTVLVDYIYHDGSYVYDVVADTDEKESIYAYQRWFEFHHDTVYKIENNIHDEYYSDNGKQIECSKDSITTKYKIEQTGKFKKIFYDSIPNK